MSLGRENIVNFVAEKFLDQLEGQDYDAFVMHLQPEMAKARLSVTGKQIAAVDKKMHRHERFDTPNMPLPTTTDPNANVQNAVTNGTALPPFAAPQSKLPPPT
jgi:mRNA-binding protein PUF3